MLSMAAARAEGYYTALAREDYYLEGGEPPGKWLGRGAEQLGLAGPVETIAFRNLYRGFSPDGNEKLVQNAGKARGDGKLSHHPGWDLTFSAPKSVSALWSQAPAEMRLAIQEAHHEAVSLTISYLEDVAGFTKRGKGGASKEPVQGFVVASFEHGTSRAQEPQLHDHCIVFNVAHRLDGTVGTLLGRPLFLEKMAAGAHYRAVFAHLLEKDVGLEVEKRGQFFEVKGVSRELVDAFSSRSKTIREAMKEKGAQGAKAAAQFNLSTRESKAHLPRARLFEKWKTEGKRHRFSERDAAALPRQTNRLRGERDGTREAVESALRFFTQSQPLFTASDFRRRVFENLQGQGFPLGKGRKHMDEVLASSDQVQWLGSLDGRSYFASHQHLEDARALLTELKTNSTRRAKGTSEKAASKAVKGVEKELARALAPHEKHAILYLTRSEEAVRRIAGLSPESRDSVLRASALALQAKGFQVIGVSPIAVGASLLTRGTRAPRGFLWALRGTETGIKSFTLGSFFRALRGKGFLEAYDSALRKADSIHGFGSTKGFLSYMGKLRKPSIKLSRKTVVVLDTPEMVKANDLTTLLEACRKSGATVSILGDTPQVKALEHAATLSIAKSLENIESSTEAMRDIERMVKGAPAQNRQAPRTRAAAEPERDR